MGFVAMLALRRGAGHLGHAEIHPSASGRMLGLVELSSMRLTASFWRYTHLFLYFAAARNAWFELFVRDAVKHRRGTMVQQPVTLDAADVDDAQRSPGGNAATCSWRLRGCRRQTYPAAPGKPRPGTSRVADGVEGLDDVRVRQQALHAFATRVVAGDSQPGRHAAAEVERVRRVDDESCPRQFRTRCAERAPRWRRQASRAR